MGKARRILKSILAGANWIVISLTDVSNGQVALLQRFFSDRPNLIRNPNVILFSFTAPYYLDPTDISKLTAYYALYSKQPAFVEVAARLLFERQQITLHGASPVSIPAVNYDLIDATSPDKDQIIPLALDQAIRSYHAYCRKWNDHTGRQSLRKLQFRYIALAIRSLCVPVRSSITIKILCLMELLSVSSCPRRMKAGKFSNQMDSTTVDGVARASFAITRPGQVEIRAVSEPAVISNVIQFDASNEARPVTVISPTPQITPTTTGYSHRDANPDPYK